MEESNEIAKVIPELYFLIAKFLTGGPLKETAKTLLKELESADVLPRRLDWLGNAHRQSYEELASKFTDVPWQRLAEVGVRALELARLAGAGPGTRALPGPDLARLVGGGPGTRALPGLDLPADHAARTATNEGEAPRSEELVLRARLSLLSDALVRDRPLYSAYKRDQSLVRRLAGREVGRDPAAAAGGRGGPALLPGGLLAGLQLQRRTLGHLSAVYCLAFDCTGRYVITGADDLLVKVWSATDGRLLGTLRGAGAEITDVCVSRDGRLLAAGSVERLVRVWELRDASPASVLSAHQGTITSVHWSPALGAQRWLASTSTDGSVAFWRVDARGAAAGPGAVQFVERLRPGACHMICAAWAAGGALLAAGSADHHVRLYTVADEGGGPRRVLETSVHSDAVDSLAWAHRGLRFVSGSKDGTAALWSLHAGHWRHTMLRPAVRDPAKKLKVTMVCWDRSDAYILTAVSDNSIRVWCARSGREQRALVAHRDEAYVLEAHPLLAGVVLSGGHDGQLLVWDVAAPQPLAAFHNSIPGQGDGAIFDAKWGDAVTVACTDSHGHLLLLGLGKGDPLFADLPTELFFHTDYRPLVRDALGGAVDEQTSLPPHVMPPAFLVDVEGLPHAPRHQRRVPGRQRASTLQLVPRGPTQLDEMIEALAAERGDAAGRGEGDGRSGGVWRGGGVRHTLGAWQHEEPRAAAPATIVQPLSPAHLAQLEQASAERYEWEVSMYRREMRRRPVMISTAPDKPRRRPARGPRPRPQARVQDAPRVEPVEPPDPASPSDSSDSSLRLSDHDHSTDHSDHSDDSSSESSYSDWEAGAAALAPPKRTRRRPQPAKRYSPSTVNNKRSSRAPAPAPASAPASPAPSSSADASPPAPSPAPAPSSSAPDLYRFNEWLTSVSPRKSPYQPQMGDVCLYFKQGHMRYYEAVSEKDVYKVGPRDKPWDLMHIYECELVKVVGIKYEVRPPRLACVRVRSVAARGRSFTLRYHDMPDVIDFLVLHAHYQLATARRFEAGARFRCMIDDSWWSGAVLQRCEPPPPLQPGSAAAAAQHFLSVKVQWDNGELERLSPWDLEPLAPGRAPAERGAAVPVLQAELEELVLRSVGDAQWPAACRRLAELVSQVMSLSAAEAFCAPVDLQLYPSYARVVAYPVDLSTIRARFQNMWYRRSAGAQWDARMLASNAERFNKPRAPIVRCARLVCDLLLHIIQEWRTADVVSKFHELAANYHSSDEEPLATKARGAQWAARAQRVLSSLAASPDAAPFMQPVAPHEAPDYHLVISHPMDLGTVQSKLSAGEYSRAAHFLDDVRRVFSNSRQYNTNKRTRIYSMTVRLSALFEELWSTNTPSGRRAPRTHRRRGVPVAPAASPSSPSSSPSSSSPSSSSSETLAETSRRVHAHHSDSDSSEDAPLLHNQQTKTKGKGVGKKSKSAAPSPQPATMRPRRGRTRSSSWSEEDDEQPLNNGQSSSMSERGRHQSTDSSYSSARRTRKRKRKTRTNSDNNDSNVQKRRRERCVSASSTSRDSDRSYRPASSDDDEPLHTYRQRREEPGPSRRTHTHNGHVRLRARRSPRRYNEQSEDEATLAISKRAKPPPTHNIQRLSLFRAATSDHDYYNHRHTHAHAANGMNGASGTSGASGTNGASEAESSSRAVSISSRGRVRKLTAKARHLLHE